MSLGKSPHDLSGSLGLLGQVEHPTVVEAIERIVTTAREAGLYVGMGMGASAEFAINSAKIGVHWLQVGNDFEYMNLFADRLYAKMRESLAGE